jgi:hypothetical protein
MVKIGPHSRPYRLAKLDGRTREAKLLGTIRADLTEHFAGQPSATQKLVIDQAAQLALRLALMDRRLAEGGVQSEADSKTYISLANSYARLMSRLGLKNGNAAAGTQSVADAIAHALAQGRAA